MKLISGKLNTNNKSNFWLAEDYINDNNIGDYAIVENLNNYDLVKITGILTTTENLQNQITGNKINKKVVMIIDKNKIENGEK